MREAVGSSLLLYLIIPIIVILIVFIGFIMNYASAYRAANYIVTQIESCQGYQDCSSKYKTEDVSKLYHYTGPIKVTCKNVDSAKVVYDVTLEVEFELPIIGKFPAFKVKAETKSMHNPTCSNIGGYN